MTAFNLIGALEAGQSRDLAMASSRPLVANGFPDARVCAENLGGGHLQHPTATVRK
jgi:hypothetical protein